MERIHILVEEGGSYDDAYELYIAASSDPSVFTETVESHNAAQKRKKYKKYLSVVDLPIVANETELKKEIAEREILDYC